MRSRLLRCFSVVARVGLMATVLTAAAMADFKDQHPIRLASNVIQLSGDDDGDGVVEPGYHEMIDLGMGAEMAGFTWDGTTDAVLELRVLLDGAWGDWIELDPSSGPDESSPETTQAPAPPKGSAGPAWLGDDVRQIEVRMTEGSATNLEVHAIDSEGPTTSGLSLTAAAEAETPMPRITTRAGWGADESYRYVNCSGNPSYASRVNFAVVHHTVNANDYSPAQGAALVRGVYHFHVHGNGWCDIGYNFLIDRYGQIYEGRAGGIHRAVIGGHAGGFNSYSTGISMVGNFDQVGVPGAAQSSLRWLLGWKLAYHGVNPQGTTTHTVASTPNNNQKWPQGTVVTLDTIVGHRDTNTTSCPGAYLYALLPGLRDLVAADIAAQGRAAFDCQWDSPSSGGSGFATPGGQRIDSVLVGAGRRISHRIEMLGLPVWSEDLGGVATSDAALSSWGPERFDVFVRGTDGGLWARTYQGGWSNWYPLGGSISASPAAVSMGPGRVDVFVCGTDGTLWTRSWRNGGWQPWVGLGGAIASAPAVASWGPGRLDVFARGADGFVWHRGYADGPGWGRWEWLGGTATSGPGTVSWGPNRIDVFIRSTGGGLWSLIWDGTRWGSWYPLGGGLGSDPEVFSTGTNRLTVEVRGLGSDRYRKIWDGVRWNPWVASG